MNRGGGQRSMDGSSNTIPAATRDGRDPASYDDKGRPYPNSCGFLCIRGLWGLHHATNIWWFSVLGPPFCHIGRKRGRHSRTG